MRWSLAVMAVLACALTGCGSSSSSTGPHETHHTSGSCAVVLTYRGRHYAALETKRPVTPGQPLAKVAPPRCGDDPGQDPALGVGQGIQAFTIAGIDPSVAFVAPSRYPDSLFFSGPLDVHPYPAEVQALIVEPG